MSQLNHSFPHLQAKPYDNFQGVDTTKNSPENADFIQKRNFCNWKGQLLSQQLKIHIPAQ